MEREEIKRRRRRENMRKSRQGINGKGKKTGFGKKKEWKKEKE